MGPPPSPAGQGSISARNKRLAELRRLVGNRRDRQDSGCFVLDGERLIGDALDAGVPIREVLFDEGAEADSLTGDILGRLRALGVRVTPVVSGALQRVVDPVTPRPIVAVVERPTAADPAAAAAHGGGVIVLDGVADPGNLGTLVRTAEAAGFAGLWAVGHATDPFSPKAVRASAGSALRMPMAVADDAAGCIGDQRRAGHVVVGARMDGTDADDMLWPERVALVLGSESHGVSPQVGALVEHWVRVPMAGYVESLNVAVAGSVLAFSVARSRAKGSGPTRPAR